MLIIWNYRIGPGGGALPYVGGYQVPVNRPPFFTQILHPMTPFFYSVHTQWPPFFHFCIKFYPKIAFFCSLCAHFEKFNDFVAILIEILQILPYNCIFAHRMTPIFGESTPNKPPFFWCPHRMTPSFRRNLTPNAPYYRHLYVTFIFECPPGIGLYLYI